MVWNAMSSSGSDEVLVTIAIQQIPIQHSSFQQPFDFVMSLWVRNLLQSEQFCCMWCQLRSFPGAYSARMNWLQEGLTTRALLCGLLLL